MKKNNCVLEPLTEKEALDVNGGSLVLGAIGIYLGICYFCYTVGKD